MSTPAAALRDGAEEAPGAEPPAPRRAPATLRRARNGQSASRQRQSAPTRREHRRRVPRAVVRPVVARPALPVMILALCTSALAFAPPRRGPCWTPLAYGRRDDVERWQSTADALTAWRGDEATVKFWRIDCDDDGFTWERRWPGRKPVIEDVAWDRITRVCWECGEWLCMDDFYLIADDDDREWVVPSGALGHGRLVDVLDRRASSPPRRTSHASAPPKGALRFVKRMRMPRRRARTARTSTRGRPPSGSGARRRKPRGTPKPPRNLCNGAGRRVSSSHSPPRSTIAPRT